MISIDELKQRFGPSLSVAPYGECIVIQGDKFNPDWEADLGDLGFACHNGDLDGHVVTFVQLKKAVAPGKVVYVPPKKPAVIPEVHSNDVKVKETEKVENEENKRVNWQPEEDALLISLWNQGSSIPDIALKVEEKYPIQKGNSANMRLKRLRIVGQIQPRNKHVREKVAEVEKVEEVEKVAEKSNRGNPRPKMPWLKDAEFWSPEEDALIVELWKKGLTLAEIGVEMNKKYPKRVGKAAVARVYQLQKKGSIEKRHKPKLKAAKAPESIKSSESEKTPETTAIEVGPENSSVEKRLQILSEAYDSLSKAYVDLKTELGNLTDFVQANIAVKYKMGTLQRDFIKHKHAVSGEAMLPPMEASAT
jgi:hypothetical protein